MKTKNIKRGEVIITIFLLSVLMFSYFHFNCAPPPAQKETSEVNKAKEDSIRLARLKEELVYNYSFGYEDYKNKEYQKALPRLLKANQIDIELNKDKLQYEGIYGFIADCYIKLGKPDSALWAYKSGLKHKPDNVIMHKGLVYVYTLKNDVEGLIEEYKILSELVKKKEEKIDFLERLKSIYVTRNEIQEALNVYDKLLEIDPQNKSYIDDRLTLLKSTGNLDLYLKDLEEKHKQYPEDINYINSLISEYEKRNESDKVIEMADKLIALQPNNLDAYEKKANAYANKLDYRTVIKIYTKMLKINPNKNKDNEKRFLVKIAEAYIFLKQYSTARNYVRRALRIDKNYGYAHFTLGYVYESCAEDVVKKKGGYQKLTFDDKLIYKLAYDEYQIASKDYETERRAKNKIAGLANFIPTNEDRFMHPNQTKAKSKEYEWIYK
ncbi:hypothetical protein DRQ09_03805 [candidate division KSB1 bacterium]|nr:MAG: hypothetical protein DRQ09_03805 [candidate division KSB1 bacterium]